MTQSEQFFLTLLAPKIDKNKAYSVNNAAMKGRLEHDAIVDFFYIYIMFRPCNLSVFNIGVFLG